MLTSLNPIARLLWLSLGSAVTLAILNDLTPLLLLLNAIVCALLVYWLAVHRSELAEKYALGEQQAAVPGPYDKLIWRAKPLLRDLAPGLVFLGLAAFFFAYKAAHGHSPERIAKLVHAIFGSSGVVAFWAVLGSLALGKGVETIVGSRAKRET